MAGKWEGFSEEDIKFYLNNPELGNRNPPSHDSREIPDLGKSRKSRKPRLVGTGTPRNLPEITSDLPETALLIKRTISPVPSEVSKQYDSNGQTSMMVEPENDSQIQDNKDLAMTTATNDSSTETLSEENLERFHARQKLLEEQNRQRKDYLARILLDRKRQTSEEARRLQMIQEELHKLDVLLGDDVSILRDQIETASREFGDAQKRFDKAEKEFMEAKHSLFAKMERKELLTKHLCTIIEQNELRKAQKLSELMDKLEIAADKNLPTTVASETQAPVSSSRKSSNPSVQLPVAESPKEDKPTHT